ncbi:tRNA (adenosine(37)-N6)-threonylcarbamoyltransferase complex dimerization subunit type 1 TsaB [Thauera sp. Sel9]|uniref:tRNA (adenosine(37)-N6)-threonylcarbamoyltransferase complex dimerization subunit type 1 TsaB n=1 Tax=Thauera sp. Sel9 TaxID=2974299 RepID=UPI0021E12956|nr:tRNA (adenosine(37)-N6)-threonylcarbamoyltransferase complex dimerization subunit type 1 TsaB [Thauera sp. Sel9]MCV2216247.1 tRNA (adenosine(37)-N6)-threonylcarbamoyltransferase complex dimerization subunit type 1 TsaB [Thauera sp. Sel9]
MKILALEASSELASVALLADGAIAARRIEGASRHSASVLNQARELLADAGLAVSALDAVAFGAGPGAFTGLRLACGVAQGLALGADLGIAAIGSLDAIALQTGAERVFVATDARMGEVYCAAFETGKDAVRAISPIRCLAPEDVELPPGCWAAAGSAFRVWPDALYTRFSDRLPVCLDGLTARADEVARLAAGSAARGDLVSPEAAAPLYIRDKVALTTAERLARGGRA